MSMAMRRSFLTALTIVLCGCGSTSTSGGQMGASPAAAGTPTATPVPQPPTASFLNIVPVGLVGDAPSGIACPMWAVLTNPKAAYTSADIQQMGVFLARMVHAAHGVYDSDPGTAPPTLQIVRVGINNPDFAGKSWNVPWCTVAMQVTNTGRATVQIPQVGLYLTDTPAPNSDQYPLVEACSVQSARFYCGPQLGGGALPCSVYQVAVSLDDGSPGTSFAGTPVANERDGTTCPEVTLAPNASVEFVLQVSSLLARDYPAEPILTVSTPTGATKYGVPAIAGHIKFADASEFSCYRSAGGSFTVDSTGAASLDWRHPTNPSNWCA